MDMPPSTEQTPDPPKTTPPTLLPVPSSLPTPAGRPIHMTHRHLPHWTCEAVIYWTTFRLADSLPQEKLKLWREQRNLWLQHNPKPWSEEQWLEYDCHFGYRLDEWLDAGYGSMVLAQPAVREVACDCLTRFEGERLQIHGAVVMPNHVHVLVEPLCDYELPKLMRGIKGASSRKANQLLGASGSFWCEESFDHIVRSEVQYRHYLRYIAENPVKAGLKAHEYWLYER